MASKGKIRIARRLLEAEYTGLDHLDDDAFHFRTQCRAWVRIFHAALVGRHGPDQSGIVSAARLADQALQTQTIADEQP